MSAKEQHFALSDCLSTNCTASERASGLVNFRSGSDVCVCAPGTLFSASAVALYSYSSELSGERIEPLARALQLCDALPVSREDPRAR